MTKPVKIKLTFRQWMRARLQTYLLRGLMVVVPLGITMYAVMICYRLTAALLVPLVRMTAIELPEYAIVILSVLLFTAIVFSLGMVAAATAGRRIIRFFEQLLQRIPLVKTIYGASKQVVDIIVPQDAGANYQAAVLVDFPFEGVKSIAFLTGKITLNGGDSFYKVFVPTTPNPTSGYLELYRPEQVQAIGLSVEDAIKSVMSAGILLPGTLENDSVQENNRRLREAGESVPPLVRPQAEKQEPPQKDTPGQGWGARFKNMLRNRLLSGILLVIPLVITGLVVRFLFSLTVGKITPLTLNLFGSLPNAVVNILSVVVFLAALYLIGMLATFVLGKRLISLGEWFINRIPFVTTVYGATKQIMQTLTMQNEGPNMKAAVLVPFPFKGAKAVGFLMGSTTDREGRVYGKVFMPTAPNITVGILLLYRLEEIEACDIGVEDAVKTVVSLGILSPENINTRPADLSMV